MTIAQQMDNAVLSMSEATTTYLRKKWYQIALSLWNKHPELQKLWDHVANARRIAARFVRKVIFSFGGRASKYDEFITLCVPVKRKVECAYGLHIVDHATGEIIASKVGTTKDIATRMRDEIIGYTESYGKQVGIRVVRFAEYNSHAETIADESFFRFALICRYPELFKDNDRFNTIEIPAKELEEIANAMQMAKKSLSRA